MTADRSGTQAAEGPVWVWRATLSRRRRTRHVSSRQPQAEGADSDASPAHMSAAPLTVLFI
jgi:hypothetical protein